MQMSVRENCAFRCERITALQVGDRVSWIYRNAYRMEGYPDLISVNRILLDYVLILLENNVFVTAALTFLLLPCSIGGGRTHPAVQWSIQYYAT